MKGAKIFFTLLIFSIAAALAGGCSAPIGGLLADSSEDYIKAEPNRFVYGTSDPFIPKEDVKVIGVFGGKVKDIPIEDVKITISDFPYSTEEDIVLDKEDVDLKENGLLLKVGRKNILISYSGKEALYRISVGETETDDGDGDGSAITIIWEWPDD